MGKEFNQKLKEYISLYLDNPEQVSWPENLNALIRLLPEDLYGLNYSQEIELEEEEVIRTALEIWPQLREFIS